MARRTKFIKNSLRNMTLVITITGFIALPTASYGNINSVMNEVLGNMSNSTSAGAYEAANRGVVSGGSFSSRSKIFNRSIISMTLPEFSAGCGGIDMFGGSFSFINVQQFIQLMRSIAANSIGLLFNIAIDYIDTLLGPNLRGFLTWIQRLNTLLSNSCQLAKGLIVDAAGAINEDLRAKASRKLGSDGIVDDFASWFDSNKKDTADATSEEEAVELGLYGNIVWNALKKEGNAIFSTTNTHSYEELMSLSGTIIINKPGDATADPNVTSDEQTIQTLPRTLSLRHFVDGQDDSAEISNLIQLDNKIYKCDSSDYCLNPTVSGTLTMNYTFKQYIEENLCGANGTSVCDGGIVGALATNGETGITDAQKNLLGSLNRVNGVGALIRKLALAGLTTSNSGALAGVFIKQASGAIATQLAYDMTMNMYDGIQLAVNSMDNSVKKDVIAMLRTNRDNLFQEKLALDAYYGSLSTITDYAIKLLETNPAGSQIKASDLFFGKYFRGKI
ncbi:MAG: conjugal transfer protein TraH [Succinivibrio sp.]|nr:conjugal transfer protein TraH [Succinivibrio sp.]